MKRFTAYALVTITLAMLLCLVWPKHSQPKTGPTAPLRATGTPGSKSLQAAGSPTPSSTAVRTSEPKRADNAAPAAGQTPSTRNAPATAGSPRKRPWDPQFLAGLRQATEGDPIRFELVAGEFAAGTIRHLEHANNEVIYVSGALTQPEPGRFFFQKQTLPGVAGDFVGVVEFPAGKKAYRLEPSGPGGASELVERPLGSVVCLQLPLPATNDVEAIPPLKPDDFPTVPIPDYQNGIIVLESLHGSIPVIYLDFQGGYTPTWGGITYDRPNVSNSQIRDVWKRVAEDYMPFNINVTTDLKVYQNAPENSRQRVVITPTTTAAPGAGGVAYIGSFNWTGDTPCWVFIISGKACAEACSHEAGHTVGLGHDGQDIGTTHVEYYGGQGSGETGWAPIMGVGYYQNVTEWSKGEYTNANNQQDDLAIITTQNNNVAYRPDDTGDTLATSRYLELFPDYTASAQGVIERTADTDAFQFTTSGGTMSLRADPVSLGPNLAIQATLYDATDQLVVSNNPQTTLWASITTNLAAGTYTFRVTGTGRNDPLTNGFSAYASLGYYSITGSVANARLPNRFVIGENTPNGTIVGVVAGNNTGTDPLSYIVVSGNNGNTFALDDTGTLSVADNTLLDYEALAQNTQLPVQFELFVNILDTTNPALNETNRRVVVAVTNVNEAPTLTGFATTALEHTQPGTLLGTVTGADPDFYTVLAYSLVAGNSNGMFALNTNSGALTVVGDLNAATQSVYNLTVAVSDQTPPTPLMATSQVTVTVLPNTTPYRPGTISYAVYTNISGNLVSALTSAPSYPYDPAFEKQLPLFEGDSNRGDNYGAVLRGYLIPPASGSYTFWIATDDNGELWLSSSTNPASIARIAYISGSGNWAGPRDWTKYASQQSAPVTLVGGSAYYIEGRLKEGTGNDNIAVAWECLSNGITRDVIPGKFLAPYFMNYVPRPVGFTANLHRDALFGARVGTVGVTDVNAGDTETFAITYGNNGGLFSIDPATGIIRVALESLLQTTTQPSYSLQVRVTDNGSPPRSGTTTVTVNIVPTNAITATSLEQEIWYNIGSGTAVSDLTSQAKYPKRPDALRALTSFDSGQNLADNYGSRIRAILTPTNTGLYTFYLSSDDSSSLKFSSSTNPATAVQIAYVNGWTDYAQWTKFSSQKSAPISLTVGNKYYLETVHKEGGGGDHVEVAWTGPGLSGTNIIAGSFLTPVDLNYAPDLAGQSLQLPITATNGTLVTTLTATDSPLDTVVYKIVSGNVGNTFAIGPDTGRLTVADNTQIATYAVSAFNLLVQAQDSGYGGLYPLRSTQATVTVQIVDNTPAFVWSGAGSDDNWSTAANWNGTAPADNSKLAFVGTSRQTNVNDLLAHAGLVTLSNGGFQLAGNPLLLLAGLASTGDNTWAIDSTLNRAQTFSSLAGTLSMTGAINNNGNLLTVLVNDGLRLEGVVSGAGGLTKAGPGTVVMSAANSYTGPTVISAGVLALTGSASLANSQLIDVQAGAVLDASGLPGVLTVPVGQTLAGRGTILGSVTVNGTIAPGPSTGALTISNRLVLAGSTVLELNKSAFSLTNDVLRVLGELDCGGTLMVTNIGDAPGSGDVFKVLDAAPLAGTFTAVVLPSLRNGLAWDASRLMVDGTLRVTPVPPQIQAPTFIDGALVIRVQTAAGLTYVVESTPSLQPPANWTIVTSVPGADGLTTIVVPVSPGQPQGFFRLRVY